MHIWTYPSKTTRSQYDINDKIECWNIWKLGMWGLRVGQSPRDDRASHRQQQLNYFCSFLRLSISIKFFPEGLWMSLPSHLDCAKFPSSKHWIANKNSILNPSWYIQYTQSPAGQHTKNKYTCVSVISCHLLTPDTCSGTRGHEIVRDDNIVSVIIP